MNKSPMEMLSRTRLKSLQVGSSVLIIRLNVEYLLVHFDSEFAAAGLLVHDPQIEVRQSIRGIVLDCLNKLFTSSIQVPFLQE